MYAKCTNVFTVSVLTLKIFPKMMKSYVHFLHWITESHKDRDKALSPKPYKHSVHRKPAFYLFVSKLYNRINIGLKFLAEGKTKFYRRLCRHRNWLRNVADKNKLLSFDT